MTHSLAFTASLSATSARTAPAVRGSRGFGSVLGGVLLLVLATGCASVQRPTTGISALRTTASEIGHASGAETAQRNDDFINLTLKQMRNASPAFDSALHAIELSGVPVRIGTEEQLSKYVPRSYRSSGDQWQALTAVYPLTRNGARGQHIDYVVVILRDEMVQMVQAAASSQAADDSTLLARHLQRVLAHEIYGHLMPQLQLGLTAPIACDDPTGAADWYTACVMGRERHVMAELTMSQNANVLLALQQQQQQQ